LAFNDRMLRGSSAYDSVRTTPAVLLRMEFDRARLVAGGVASPLRSGEAVAQTSGGVESSNRRPRPDRQRG
jgi:hypothetical protein